MSALIELRDARSTQRIIVVYMFAAKQPVQLHLHRLLISFQSPALALSAVYRHSTVVNREKNAENRGVVQNNFRL